MSLNSRSTGKPQALARPGALARWLFAVVALIVGIVVVGGITRLTESGLSITQWHPVSGIVPPLGEAAWQAEFDHYRAIDQYGAVHAGMTLGQFKGIFFWEYIHRVLGRLIGLAMVGPLVGFALRRQIPAGFGARLLALPALVAVQGLLGWLMVASGLKPGMTEVAPGWLAAHLVTALLTLSVTLWIALDLATLARDPAARPARITALPLLTGAALAVQLMYGALMAGLRAGKVTDQWPLMNGRFFPGATQPGRSLGALLFDDPAIVHFIHRWFAWVVVALLIAMGRRLRRVGARRESIFIHSAFGTQIILGISTVMSGVSLWLAVLHQLVGALLVVATVAGAHQLGRRGPGQRK
jgi:cytochrome c oxidase assembly protein subunit 15